jgi:hypothetical protein
LAHSRSKCGSFWLACEHQGTQFALADHPADLPEGEEWDQCDSKDDSHKKHFAWSSAADNGDALANVFPLNTPTITSSTTSKTKNNLPIELKQPRHHRAFEGKAGAQPGKWLSAVTRTSNLPA